MDGCLPRVLIWVCGGSDGVIVTKLLLSCATPNMGFGMEFEETFKWLKESWIWCTVDATTGVEKASNGCCDGKGGLVAKEDEEDADVKSPKASNGSLDCVTDDDVGAPWNASKSSSNPAVVWDMAGASKDNKSTLTKKE